MQVLSAETIKLKKRSMGLSNRSVKLLISVSQSAAHYGGEVSTGVVGVSKNTART